MFRAIEYERKGKNPLPVKDFIIRRCNERKDNLADNVRIRLEGAVGDLHAAEVRYHVDCRQRFHTPGRSLDGSSDTKAFKCTNKVTDV